jgi:hypothetical protein
MAKRKRAPGGGRKPAGDFNNLTVPFSVRMPARMRDQIEAARGRRSAGQEVLTRLQESFKRDEEQDRIPSLRALCFLMAEVGEGIHYWDPEGWRYNRFLFVAFTRAVTKLLEALTPAGQIKTPDLMRVSMEVESPIPAEAERIKSIARSPEALADDAFRRVWSALQTPRKPQADLAFLDKKFPDMPGIGSQIFSMQERTYYGMQHAARDLAAAKPRRRKKP